MTPSVTARAATEEDEAFLFALFTAVRSPEFAYSSLAPPQLDLLMKVQYAGQKQTYGVEYPGGDQIVLLDGLPAGRIWLFRGEAEHRLVDISLLPEYRNRGIGGLLVSGAITAAGAAGVPLCCSVAVTNPASLRFHQRMGFQIVGRDEIYYDLAIDPGRN